MKLEIFGLFGNHEFNGLEMSNVSADIDSHERQNVEELRLIS